MSPYTLHALTVPSRCNQPNNTEETAPKYGEVAINTLKEGFGQTNSSGSPIRGLVMGLKQSIPIKQCI